MTELEFIQYETVDRVGVITLNRPERRNALSLPLMQELTTALVDAAGDVVVLAGAGPVFSAGHDLNELATCDTLAATELFDACTTLMLTIQSIGQPVIARVHGVATAAGCQLVASCDLAVAEEGARFATPGVRIGLFCSTPMVPLSRVVSPKRAMKMLLTGDLIDAATALDWGLVNAVVPLEELEATTISWANELLEKSPLALRLLKSGYNAGVDGLAGVQHLAGDATLLYYMSEEAQEGRDAYKEKRTPDFSRFPKRP
jgi:enoyl-CoA hydratase/carnithine racemase